MNESTGMKKGEHKRAMEKSKEMIDRGCGLGEIVSETHLKEDDVIKSKKKWVDQS